MDYIQVAVLAVVGIMFIWSLLKKDFLMVALSLIVLGYFASQKITPINPERNIITKVVSPDQKVLATVDGKPILESELIKPELSNIFNLQKQEYNIKKELLRHYVTEYYINKWSEEEKISFEDYLDKKVLPKNIPVSDKEVDAFIKEQNITEEALAQQGEDVKNKIKDFLKGNKRRAIVEKYVTKKIGDAPIEVYFAKPEIKIDITDADPSWGDKSAQITIVKFSDFECPYCAQAAQTINQLKLKYKDRLRVVYKQLPLPIHANAYNLSVASLCLHDQKKAAFWTFYQDIYSLKRTKSTEDILKEIPDTYKLDKNKYNACLTEKVFDSQVNADVQQADELGLSATPVFIVNGELIMGAAPISEFEKVIEGVIKP